MTPLQLRESSDDRPVFVDVVEPGHNPRRGWLRCEIGTNLNFSLMSLESYFFARWEPVLYDALLVAAAIEFCDRTYRRLNSQWARDIALRIAVHDADRWNHDDVTKSLTDTLNFLTGDRWHLSFYKRKHPECQPRQRLLTLGQDVIAVIPFSNGMDSRAVAGIMASDLGAGLVRVRLGSKEQEESMLPPQPFTAVPYRIRSTELRFRESSARSRGFKFALISGIAAYLASASRVIVPEGGQGALGPWLVTVGQAYEDYRSHPLFTARMEKFLLALLGKRISFEFPRLWYTKSETLFKFVNECKEGTSTWAETWSCWQQNRHVGVMNKKRQCGVCAACLLRRMSVHAADLTERKDTYVWENLGASAFEQGAAASFDAKKITRAMREHAIAGALHLDHLASFYHSQANLRSIPQKAFQLSNVCKISEVDVSDRMQRLLHQHEIEWKHFLQSLGPNSFVTNWTAFGK